MKTLPRTQRLIILIRTRISVRHCATKTTCRAHTPDNQFLGNRIDTAGDERIGQITGAGKQVPQLRYGIAYVHRPIIIGIGGVFTGWCGPQGEEKAQALCILGENKRAKQKTKAAVTIPHIGIKKCSLKIISKKQAGCKTISNIP